jgi:hypothetical protein
VRTDVIIEVGVLTTYYNFEALVRKNYSVILFWSFWGILVQILAILYSVLFWYSGGVGGVGGSVGIGVLCFFFVAMQPETPKRARDEAIIIDDATPTQRARSEEDVAVSCVVSLSTLLSA